MRKYIYMFLLMCFISPYSVFADTNLTIMPIETSDWGDATLLESNGEYMLIDVAYGESTDILDFLDSNKVTKLDLYLSHYHSDHYGSRNELMVEDYSSTMSLMEYIIRSDKYDVGTLYLPDDLICKNKSLSWCNNLIKRLINASNEKNTEVVMLNVGSKFALGNTTAEVLYLNNDETIASNVDTLINNSSLVTMFTNGKTKFLTAGDIEKITENTILENEIDISADIFKLNHHGIQIGSEISNTKNFIDAVKPKYSYFQFNTTEYSYGYNAVQQSIINLSQYSNIYANGINGNIKFVIKNDVITPIIEKNVRKITINYIDEESNEKLDTREYDFSYNLYDENVNYHLYDFEKNFQGYVVNDETLLFDTTGFLENDITYDITYNKLPDEIWVNFIEKYKNTELLKTYNDDESLVEIVSSNKLLSVIFKNQDKEYTTNFAYEDGILKYQSSSEDFEILSSDNIWILNTLYALCDSNGYNLKKVIKWLDNNDDKTLTIENDGIKFITKDFSYENNENGVSVSVDTSFVTFFELDIENGLKSYDESLISAYEFVSGENQSYKVGESTELKFVVDGDLADFDSVYINNVLLEQSNYTVSSGSTVILLNNNYLNTLESGIYDIKVVYNDGEFVQTEFTIERETINPDTGMNFKFLIPVLIASFVGTYLLVIKYSKLQTNNL